MKEQIQQQQSRSSYVTKEDQLKGLEKIEKLVLDAQIATAGAEGIANIMHFMENVAHGIGHNIPDFNLDHFCGGVHEVAFAVKKAMTHYTDSIEREVWALRRGLEKQPKSTR